MFTTRIARSSLPLVAGVAAVCLAASPVMAMEGGQDLTPGEEMPEQQRARSIQGSIVTINRSANTLEISTDAKQVGKQTGDQADKQTGMHADKRADKQTDKQVGKQQWGQETVTVHLKENATVRLDNQRSSLAKLQEGDEVMIYLDRQQRLDAKGQEADGQDAKGQEAKGHEARMVSAYRDTESPRAQQKKQQLQKKQQGQQLQNQQDAAEDEEHFPIGDPDAQPRSNPAVRNDTDSEER